MRVRTGAMIYRHVKNAADRRGCAVRFVVIELPFDVWLDLDWLARLAVDVRERNIDASFDIARDAYHDAGNVILKRFLPLPCVIREEVHFDVDLLRGNAVSRRDVHDRRLSHR